MNNTSAREPIAVIGTACCFPGGVNSLAEYWQFLIDGNDAVDTVPSNRWDWRFFYDEDATKKGKMPINRGGFLKRDIEMFDAAFFDISPREASVLDPQQRLMLELTYEALADAVGDVNEARGSRTGVYVGAFMLDNMVTQMGPGTKSQVGIHTAVSSTMTMISNRLSYTFDLRGPSFTMDTACSSSLVATHQACRGLLSGDCDMALAGGVSIMFRPEVAMMMSKGNFLARDGRSKTFSANADGYGRGEGGGIVVLKRLSDAVRDGDTIHAVLRGSGANQDGSTDGITVPSEKSQSLLAREVYAEAGIEPAEIGYLEAHGTGTPVGDPIEMGAIGGVVGKAREPGQPLVVGSVKAGIGHLEAAAGIAGLLKGVLVAKHGEIPPQAWLDTELNPLIDFDDLNIRIADKRLPLQRSSEGRGLVAVNSFGYGGTNAHVLVESYDSEESLNDAAAELYEAANSGYVLGISAEADDAIASTAGVLAEQLREAGDVKARQLCVAMSKSTQHSLRAGVCAADVDELRERLLAVSTGETPAGVVRGRAAREARQVAFVYSGMGPQWWGMGRQLYKSNALFRSKLDQADEIFRKISGWSVLTEMMKPAEKASRISETEVAQPANFMLQMGLTEVLRAHGVIPSAVIGHSVGEVSSAYASGSLTLEQALTVAYHRSRTQAKTAGTGTMLAVGMAAAELSNIIQPYEGSVAIAGVNSASNSTVAGDEASLDEILAILEEREVFARKLAVEVPYHSPGMDPILEELEQSLLDLSPATATIPLYSTVSGERVEESGFDARYWCDNVREPVYFQMAVETMLNDGHTLFLELGPHSVLSHYIKETIANHGGSALCLSSLRRNEDEAQKLRELTAGLWANGVKINMDEVHAAQGTAPVPAYPWQRKRHWHEDHQARMQRQGWGEDHKLLGRKLAEPQPTWQSELSAAIVNWLPDHKVGEQIVFPGAGYVETLLACMKQQVTDGNLILRNIEFQRALVIDNAEDPYLRTVASDDGSLAIYSSLPSRADEWQLHCQARVVSGKLEEPEFNPKNTDNWESSDVGSLYQRLIDLKLNYGECFQTIRSVRHTGSSAVAQLQVPSGDGYSVHPGLLDGAFQALLTTAGTQGDATYLPTHIEEIRVFGEVDDQCTAVLDIVSADQRQITANITLISDNKIKLQLVGVRCSEADLGIGSQGQSVEDLIYSPIWTEAEPVEQLHEYRHIALVNNQARPQLAKQLRVNSEVTEFSTLSACANAGELADIDQVVLFVNSDSAEQALEDACATLEGLQSISRQAAAAPVLTMVTDGCQTADNGGELAGRHSAWVIGFRRNFMNEVKEFSYSRHIDVDGPADDAELVVELLAADAPDEVQLHAGKRSYMRLMRLRNSDYRRLHSTRVRPFVDDGSNSFCLQVPAQKSLASLVFDETSRRMPGPSEVEVCVDVVGLNFKDLAKVRGLLTTDMVAETNAGMSLGLECSGTVMHVGSDVTRFAVGDSVIVSAGDCFRRYLTVNTDSTKPGTAVVAKNPTAISTAEAASLPVAYATALLTLRNTARLTAGETVLIHGAAGGVGIAAVHVAKWLGAKVIATAGSDEKREYLLSIGADVVLNSRTLDFADQARQATDGRGVDVVLNSIGGGVAVKSFDALADFGRFVEIGKFDVLAGNPLDSKPFNRNLVYACVDLDFLTAANRDAVYSLIYEAVELIDQGVLAPLPVTEFDSQSLGDAFSFLNRSKHIGKVVVRLDGQAEVSRVKRREVPLSADKTMLITGGLGGVGAMLANWCIDNGARKIALLSRSGVKNDEQQAIVEKLQQRGADVVVHACDAGDKGQLANVIAASTPLGGVIHAAGVLDDRPFIEMDAEAYRKVSGTKIIGANNLHELTLDNPDLELFVTISSVSALTGHTMQSNYCLGNSYMDGLCHYRQLIGLPGNSINLGPVASAGMAASDEGLAQYLALMGLGLMDGQVVQASLQSLYERNLPQQAYVDVTWPIWEYGEPSAAKSARFSKIIGEEGDQNSGTSLVKEIARLPKGEQIETVSYILAEHIAEILQMESQDVAIEAPIDSFGIDSLTAVEFQSIVNRSMGVEVSVLSMLSGKTLRDVAAEIVELMDFEQAPTAPSLSPSAVEQPAKTVAQTEKLGDTEVTRVAG